MEDSEMNKLNKIEYLLFYISYYLNMHIKDIQYHQALLLIASIAMILLLFYFNRIISFSIGLGSGISIVANIYGSVNRTILSNSSLSSIVASVPTLKLAIYIIYLMLLFDIVILSISVSWIFSRQYIKFTSILLAFSAFIGIILLVIMQFNFSFNQFTLLAAYYVMSFIVLFIGVAVFMQHERSTHIARIQSLEINPNTPYSNLFKISNKIFSKLSGNVYILDMHFDLKGLENLSKLLQISQNTQISGINILAKKDRIAGEFEKWYFDFEKEMRNKGIIFELRVLVDQDAQEQHERLLIDSARAYKIPPLNIINKKSEHIVSIDYKSSRARFDTIWSRSLKFENYMIKKE
jgi:hypothetical protein